MLRGVLEHPEPYRGHAPGIASIVRESIKEHGMLLSAITKRFKLVREVELTAELTT